MWLRHARRHEQCYEAIFCQLHSSASSSPVQLDSSPITRVSSSNKLHSHVKRSVNNHGYFVTGAGNGMNYLTRPLFKPTLICLKSIDLLVFIFNCLILPNITFYLFLIIYFVLLIAAAFLHFIIITNTDHLDLLLILFTLSYLWHE